VEITVPVLIDFLDVTVKDQIFLTMPNYHKNKSGKIFVGHLVRILYKTAVQQFM